MLNTRRRGRPFRRIWPTSLAGLLALVAAASCGGDVACGGRGQRVAPAPPVLAVGAAAGLRRALPALIEAYQSTRSDAPALVIRVSYAGSGTLRRQLEAGAPFDLLLTASPVEVDAAIAGDLADPRTRRVVATNQLVLVGAPGVPARRFEELASLPSDARLAVGNPAFVPAGRYAREALAALGVWDALRGRRIYTADVTAALALAQRGEVEAAIVYASDCRSIADVAIWDRGQPPWAPVPQFVGVVLRGAARPEEARELLAFAGSPEGAAVLRDFGFDPAGEEGGAR